MPWTVRAPTFGGTGSGASTTFTLAEPAGLSVGDECWIFVGSRVAAATWTTPTGFSPLSVVAGSNSACQAFSKIIDGTESWPLTITSTGTKSQCGVCIAVPGANTSTPMDPTLTVSGQINASSTTITVALGGTGTTLVPGDIAFWFGFDTAAAGGTPMTVNAPSGFTLQGSQVNTSSAANTNIGMAVATSTTVAATPGAVANQNGSLASAVANGGFLVILQPAVSAVLSIPRPHRDRAPSLRGRAAQPVPGGHGHTPLPIAQHHPRPPLRTTRGRVVPLPPEHTSAPPRSAPKRRQVPTAVRRGHIATPILPQVTPPPVWSPQPPRHRPPIGAPARRGRLLVPVPAQVPVAVWPLQIPPARLRLRGWPWVRRGATVPLTVSTFGETIDSGTLVGGLANYLFATQYTMPTSGYVTSMSLYIVGPGNVKVAIYADNGGSPGPLVVANNAATAMVVNRWNTVALPTTFLGAGVYWVGAVYSAANMVFYATVVPNQLASNNLGSFANPPAIFPSPSLQNYDFFSYVSYTPFSPPLPLPIAQRRGRPPLLAVARRRQVQPVPPQTLPPNPIVIPVGRRRALGAAVTAHRSRVAPILGEHTAPPRQTVTGKRRPPLQRRGKTGVPIQPAVTTAPQLRRPTRTTPAVRGHKAEPPWTQPTVPASRMPDTPGQRKTLRLALTRRGHLAQLPPAQQTQPPVVPRRTKMVPPPRRPRPAAPPWPQAKPPDPTTARVTRPRRAVAWLHARARQAAVPLYPNGVPKGLPGSVSPTQRGGLSTPAQQTGFVDPQEQEGR